MTTLTAQLTYIRDFECSTPQEKKDMNEAIRLIEQMASSSKTFENMANEGLTRSGNILPQDCDSCMNNPKNGGSGICHCIIGSPKITC